MKTLPFIASLLLPLAHAQLLTPEIKTALEVKVSTKAGFVYELLSGATPGSETATGKKLTGTGLSESFLLPKDSPKAFYRVTESQGPLATFIPGLTEADFSNSRAELANGILEVSNVRVLSTNLDKEDSVSIEYAFDPARQSFQPVEVDTSEEAGPAFLKDNRFFPINDGPETIDVKIAGTSIPANQERNLTVPATGLDIDVSLKRLQVLGLRFRVLSPFRVSYIGEDFTEESSFDFVNTNFFAQPTLGGFTDSDFKIRLTPIGSTSATLGFIHLNGNTQTKPPLTSGNSFTAQTNTHSSEYQKYPVQLSAGQKIVLNGRFLTDGGIFLLTDSAGKVLSSLDIANNGSGIFELTNIEKTGQHYMIFHGRDFEINGFTGVYSVGTDD